MDNKTTGERIRKLWEQSGYTYKELSELTGITENTLANWITENKERRRNPPEYVYKYIKMKIKEKQIKTNGDVIRRMTDKELIMFLTVLNELVEDRDMRQFVCDNDMIKGYNK